MIRDGAVSQVANGHVTRVVDEDIQSSVLELVSANVATTYITCPADKAATLGVKLPYLVMVVRTAPHLSPARLPSFPHTSQASHSYTW